MSSRTTLSTLACSFVFALAGLVAPRIAEASPALSLLDTALARPNMGTLGAWSLEDIGDDGGSGGSAGPFGLGIILGEPTGFTLKVSFSRESALQAHIGYGVGRRGRLLLAIDYLFTLHNLIGRVGRAGHLSPYVGIGGHLGVREDDDAFLGLRIPLGLSLMLSAAPLEIFAEVAPGMGVLPRTTALVDGGLGLRFYF